MEILVVNPDDPSQLIWVPAQWNLITGHLESIDRKYRNDSPALFNVRQYRNQFADDGSTNSFDFSGPLNLGLPGGGNTSAVAPIIPTFAPAASQSGSGGVLIVVAALALLYLWSQG
jgi:hypothetical protein